MLIIWKEVHLKPHDDCQMNNNNEWLFVYLWFLSEFSTVMFTSDDLYCVKACRNNF